MTELQVNHIFNQDALEGLKTLPDEWWMGEYAHHYDPKLASIVWRKIVIREAGLKASEVVGRDEAYELWKQQQRAKAS